MAANKKASIKTLIMIYTLVRYKRAIGILGIFFAILGGIAWFFQQIFLAIILWGIAAIVILRLNKQKKYSTKKRN